MAHYYTHTLLLLALCAGVGVVLGRAGALGPVVINLERDVKLKDGFY